MKINLVRLPVEKRIKAREITNYSHLCLKEQSNNIQVKKVDSKKKVSNNTWGEVLIKDRIRYNSTLSNLCFCVVSRDDFLNFNVLHLGKEVEMGGKNVYLYN